MDYSIEQEKLWLAYIHRSFPIIYNLRFFPHIGVLEASVQGGVLRYYVRPGSNALIPFYFSSRRWLDDRYR